MKIQAAYQSVQQRGKPKPKPKPKKKNQQRIDADSLVAEQRKTRILNHDESPDSEESRLRDKVYAGGKLRGAVEIVKAQFRDRPAIQAAYNKVDTVGVKKRMAADEGEYAANEKDRAFWESTAQGLRNSPNTEMKKDSRRRADGLMQSQLRTGATWSARRDTLNTERAKPTKRKR